METIPEYHLDFIPKLHNICSFQAICALFSLLLRFGAAVLVISNTDSPDPEDSAFQYLRVLLIAALDGLLFGNALFGIKLIRKISYRQQFTATEIFLQARLFASLAAVNILLCCAHAAACALVLIPGVVTVVAYYMKAHSVLMDQVTWMQTVFGRQQLDDAEIAISMLYSLMVAVLCGKASKICLRNAVILRDSLSRAFSLDGPDHTGLLPDGNYHKNPPPYSEHDPALQQALV